MASTATAGERPQRSEEELRAASNRLWHEYWMLRCAARLKTEDPMLAAALEETFALHLRNLAAFLYGEFGDSLLNSTIDANAVLAEDFMGPRWFELRPERTELLEDALCWAARRAGALRYGAADAEPPRGWTLVQASFELQKVMDTFISNLPRRLFGSKWSIDY